ncbi:MAG: hypothetical protein HQM15_09205 [Deltaproteobacteria bacterium]|nr:hypothetical protein [Deltaproteobacteria bacterium]
MDNLYYKHCKIKSYSFLSFFLVALFISGCNFLGNAYQESGKKFSERVILESPELAQQIFHLVETPEVGFRKEQEKKQYPDWISGVDIQFFNWKQDGKEDYTAQVVAEVHSSPWLQKRKALSPVSEKANIHLTIRFYIKHWPAPIIFFPESKDLEPYTWELTLVDGKESKAKGFFRDYLSY